MANRENGANVAEVLAKRLAAVETLEDIDTLILVAARREHDVRVGRVHHQLVKDVVGVDRW